MDATVNVEPEATSGVELDSVEVSVGEKRHVENGAVCSPEKKSRCGPPGAMKRVAEIVLVLSAMAKIRGGGRTPTDVEIGLMAEARETLAEMCGGLTPGDIVGRDAIGAIIEDLGLNGKLKEQRLGFRAPKLTIAERFSLASKKMEESKKFPTPAPYTSQQTSHGGLSHTVRNLPSDRPSHATISTVGFPVVSPLAPVTAAALAPLPHQLATNEGRSLTVSTGHPSGHLGRDLSSFSIPRVDRHHIKLDGGSTMPSYVSQAAANHPVVNAPSWSMQPQTTGSSKSGQENKPLNHNSSKVQGMGQAGRDQAFRPFITQTSPGTLPSMHQSMQGMNFVQTSPFVNTHNEIAKIVQKLLQPKLPEHPTWTPPSREYMNKALACQTCKLTITDVESVLICDACEKGFHLKCLQSNNQKAIPRGEWHCLKCLSLCNGKPLPPKYGRVMRSITPPKAPSNAVVGQSNTAETQLSSENKIENPDPKFNQQKMTANGSSGMQNSAIPSSMGSNLAEPASDAKSPKGSTFSSTVEEISHGASTGTFPNDSIKSLGDVSVSPSVVPSTERSSEHPQKVSSMHEERKAHESKSLSADIQIGQQECVLVPFTNSEETDSMAKDLEKSQVRTDVGCSSGAEHNNEQDTAHVDPAQSPDSMAKDLENSQLRTDDDCSSGAKHNEQDTAQADPAQTPGANNEIPQHIGVSSDSLLVEWIGDILQIVDGKKIYQSCCVNGVTYKVQDYALIHSSHDRAIPSKLQGMWEDVKTSSKWVVINRCYFPGDLPETVGLPSSPESSEVYESHNDSTVMASLIQGPCEVLTPAKFKEENERSQLGTDANKGSRPIFICKWLYDESKQNFQPRSS